jgi:hypothetical protein
MWIPIKYLLRFLKATERVGFGDNLSVTGDTMEMIPKSRFVLNDQLTVEKSCWWKTLALVLPESTQLGSLRLRISCRSFSFFCRYLKETVYWCFTSASKS